MSGPHPEFRDAPGRLDALRMADGSKPVRRGSRVRRGLALVVLLGLVAAAVLYARPRTSSVELDLVGAMPAGMAVVEDADWCRRVGWRDRVCSAVGFLSAPEPESEEAARDRLVAELTSRGWRVATAPGLLFRDGRYVRVRPMYEVPPTLEDLDEAKARAAAHRPPAKLQVIVYAWPEDS